MRIVEATNWHIKNVDRMWYMSPWAGREWTCMIREQDVCRWERKCQSWMR
jgi:hypothetical protein